MLNTFCPPHPLKPKRSALLMLALWGAQMTPTSALAQAQLSPTLDAVTIVEKKSTPSLTLEVPGQVSAQSVLSHYALTDIATPLADFGSLANLTPSFVSSAPNGVGFDAAKNMSLRGFTDGQFNVTFDGIPLQDPDTFKHHSTSVFPVGSLQSLSVDRSPGSGTSLGYSTLGGSIDLQSLSIPKVSQSVLYASTGSFGTQLLGARYNTANVKSPSPLNSRMDSRTDSRLDAQDEPSTAYLLNAERMISNGALSFAGGQKSDLLVKSESHWGALTWTALLSYDAYQFNNPPSVTAPQVSQYGAGAGFNANPLDANYFGYSSTTRNTDFEYLKGVYQINPQVSLRNTLYAYAYMSDGLGINGDPTSSKVGTGFGVNANDIAGNATYNAYRTRGDVLEMEINLGPESQGGANVQGQHSSVAADQLKLGLWMEESHQNANRQALDLVTQQGYALNKLNNSSTLYNFNDQLRTLEPYANLKWHASERWSFESGLRLQRVERALNGATLPTSLPGTNGVIGKTVTSTLPSLGMHYTLDAHQFLYAQWSRGAIVPLLSYFNTTTPMLSNQAAPETGVGLQMGWNWSDQNSRLNWDVYQVNLENYFSKVVVAGNTQYINNGAVSYRGVEAEGQTKLSEFMTLFGNASLIRAQFDNNAVTSATQKAGDTLSFAPTYLGLLGFMYQRGDWSANLTSKWVSGQYQGKNGSADGSNYFVPSYNYTNLSVFKYLDVASDFHELKLGLTVSNLLNQTPLTDTAGPSAAGPLLVNVLAPRSYLLSLSAKL
jgi:iron complex outermembrane recepter protein